MAGTSTKKSIDNKSAENTILYIFYTLREIVLVVLTKRSQVYIFSKRDQKFCKTYQHLKVDGTKYATKFFL